MKKQQDYIDVRGDGRIVLYKRAGLKNPKWQARIRVPNATGYKVISTKCSDLVQAQVFATNLYEELYFTVKAGGSLNAKTFQQVFDEWEKSLTVANRTRHGGSWKSTVDRVRSYALVYFSSKKIDEISSKDFAEYWDWRHTNYTKKPPTLGTLTREKTSIIPLFKFAEQRNYITTLPKFGAPRTRSERRSTFTAEEYTTLYTKARRWVKEAEHLATWRDRFVAQQYFLVLANTGLRVGEARNLRWSDLRTVRVDDTTQLIAWVKGKTGAREVVFQPGSDVYIKRLYDLRVDELRHKPEPDGYVFCHRDGRRILSFKNSFKSLMKFSELPTIRNGMTRTIYSLRHFYATQRLENETSPFLLAKQMGTSVEMLERFYGHTTVNASTVRNVSRGVQKARASEGNEYPFE